MAKMEENKERRKFVRLNALVDVVYAKQDSASVDTKLSLAKNISKGGICLILYEKPKTSDLLQLKIYLPEDAPPIVALGKVAWSKEFTIGEPSSGKRYDAGIEFLKINNKDLSRVNKYIFRYLT